MSRSPLRPHDMPEGALAELERAEPATATTARGPARPSTPRHSPPSATPTKHE
jgi:hypothetical protein